MSPESQCFLVLVKIRWESVFVHKVYPRKGWKSKQNCLRDMSSQENYILCEFCYHRKITIILPYKRAMVSSVSRTLWSNSAEMTLFRSIFIWFIPTENVRNIILGKRRRADQIGGAQKKQKVDSVTQQDLEDVTRRAGEAAPHGNITDSWIEVMKTWWRKIRRSRNWTQRITRGMATSELFIFYGHLWTLCDSNRKNSDGNAPKAREKMVLWLKFSSKSSVPGMSFSTYGGFSFFGTV